MADSDRGRSIWWSDPMLSFSTDELSLSFRPSPSARQAEVAAEPDELGTRDDVLPAVKIIISIINIIITHAD